MPAKSKPTETTPRKASRRPAREASGRRAELLEIASGTFAEKGVKGTTTRDIAQRAEILSGSLYHHFESKESMVDEIVRGYWTELFARYDQILEDQGPAPVMLERLVRASLELAMTHRNEVLILHQDWHYLLGIVPYIDDMMSRVAEVWMGVLRAGIVDGAFRADVDPALAYRTMMGAISWLPRWFDARGPLSLDDVIATQAGMFLSGLESRR